MRTDISTRHARSRAYNYVLRFIRSLVYPSHEELFARSTPNKDCLCVDRRWIRNLHRRAVRWVYRVYFKLGRSAFVVSAHELRARFPVLSPRPLVFLLHFLFLPFNRSPPVVYVCESYCPVSVERCFVKRSRARNAFYGRCNARDDIRGGCRVTILYFRYR